MYKKERFETVLSLEELMGEYYDLQLTAEKCRQCTGYRKTWSCPEFHFNPTDFLKGFSTFRFIVDRVSNQGARTPEEAQNRLFYEKSFFDREMRELEASVPGSYALAAQECVQCDKCARLWGRPCIHPEIMRYGPEALGMLVVKLIEDKFHFIVQWSDGISVPDYYVLAGGIMLS